MIINNSTEEQLKVTAERNKLIGEHERTNSRVPFCGHDFWEQAKKMDFGDIILCNRCNVYYAKIKHLPWIVEEKLGWDNKVVGHHTNHLDGCWFTPVTARVTD